MCTKAVTVDVRGMADRLKAPIILPEGKSASKEQADKADTFPTDYTAVITQQRPREIQFMRWGLVPGFAESPKDFPLLYNARAETLTTKASFRDLIMTSRCLVLGEGFYEFQKTDSEQIEWKISPSNADYFYKAGLWTTWRDRQTGETLDSFTIITTDPGNSEFGKIHDRIPIIMTREERLIWMNPATPKEKLMSLLKPCDESMYELKIVNRKPLKSASKGRGKSGDQQNSLF